MATTTEKDYLTFLESCIRAKGGKVEASILQMLVPPPKPLKQLLQNNQRFQMSTGKDGSTFVSLAPPKAAVEKKMAGKKVDGAPKTDPREAAKKYVDYVEALIQKSPEKSVTLAQIESRKKPPEPLTPLLLRHRDRFTVHYSSGTVTLKATATATPFDIEAYLSFVQDKIVHSKSGRVLISSLGDARKSPVPLRKLLERHDHRFTVEDGPVLGKAYVKLKQDGTVAITMYLDFVEQEIKQSGKGRLLVSKLGSLRRPPVPLKGLLLKHSDRFVFLEESNGQHFVSLASAQNDKHSSESAAHHSARVTPPPPWQAVVGTKRSSATVPKKHRPNRFGGYMFQCNNKTQADCLQMLCFGSPFNALKDMERTCLPFQSYLFLYNFQAKRFVGGIFTATSPPARALCATSWIDRFPATVLVTKLSPETNFAMPRRSHRSGILLADDISAMFRAASVDTDKLANKLLALSQTHADYPEAVPKRRLWPSREDKVTVLLDVSRHCGCTRVLGYFFPPSATIKDVSRFVSTALGTEDAHSVFTVDNGKRVLLDCFTFEYLGWCKGSETPAISVYLASRYAKEHGEVSSDHRLREETKFQQWEKKQHLSPVELAYADTLTSCINQHDGVLPLFEVKTALPLPSELRHSSHETLLNEGLGLTLVDIEGTSYIMSVNADKAPNEPDAHTARQNWVRAQRRQTLLDRILEHANNVCVDMARCGIYDMAGRIVSALDKDRGLSDLEAVCATERDIVDSIAPLYKDMITPLLLEKLVSVQVQSLLSDTAPDSVPWTSIEQSALERGLKNTKRLPYTKKWKAIAAMVVSRTAEECVERYKYILRGIEVKQTLLANGAEHECKAHLQSLLALPLETLRTIVTGDRENANIAIAQVLLNAPIDPAGTISNVEPISLPEFALPHEDQLLQPTPFMDHAVNPAMPVRAACPPGFEGTPRGPRLTIDSSENSALTAGPPGFFAAGTTTYPPGFPPPQNETHASDPSFFADSFTAADPPNVFEPFAHDNRLATDDDHTIPLLLPGQLCDFQTPSDFITDLSRRPWPDSFPAPTDAAEFSGDAAPVEVTAPIAPAAHPPRAKTFAEMLAGNKVDSGFKELTKKVRINKDIEQMKKSATGGYLFYCTNETVSDSFSDETHERGIFGEVYSAIGAMQDFIQEHTPLFMYHFDQRAVEGPFFAEGVPALNICKTIFFDRTRNFCKFPAQVRVRSSKEYLRKKRCNTFIELNLNRGKLSLKQTNSLFEILGGKMKLYEQGAKRTHSFEKKLPPVSAFETVVDIASKMNHPVPQAQPKLFIDGKSATLANNAPGYNKMLPAKNKPMEAICAAIDQLLASGYSDVEVVVSKNMQQSYECHGRFVDLVAAGRIYVVPDANPLLVLQRAMEKGGAAAVVLSNTQAQHYCSQATLLMKDPARNAYFATWVKSRVFPLEWHRGKFSPSANVPPAKWLPRRSQEYVPPRHEIMRRDCMERCVNMIVAGTNSLPGQSKHQHRKSAHKTISNWIFDCSRLGGLFRDPMLPVRSESFRKCFEERLCLRLLSGTAESMYSSVMDNIEQTVQNILSLPIEQTGVRVEKFSTFQDGIEMVTFQPMLPNAEKLTLFKSHYSDLALAHKRLAYDDANLDNRIFSMLQRYTTLWSLNSGAQGALPDAVFEVLKKELDVQTECFASPLNHRLAKYCSAFEDTDQCFGSLGSFYNVGGLQGSYECNPPFDTESVVACLGHIHTLIEEADSNGVPLSFAVFFGRFEKNDRVQERIDSLKHSIRGSHLVHDHVYLYGFQHCPQGARTRVNEFWKPDRATRVLLIQSEEGFKNFCFGLPHRVKEILVAIEAAFKPPSSP
jgi:hypothetical protein